MEFMKSEIGERESKRVVFSKKVLDDFRHNVGKFKAETGGMIGSTTDENRIDLCHFDAKSVNTAGSFYYDVESMSEVFRSWKDKGYTTNGIYHSHPLGATRPSFHDISTALLHIDFFELDYFYMPILQRERKQGNFKLYFYIVKKVDENLEVYLQDVIQATTVGYRAVMTQNWKKIIPISELQSYRRTVDKETTCNNQVKPAVENQVNNNHEVESIYFSKVQSLYPRNVLEKVIVCVGTGGARSALENFARSGFRNYILIDKDIVSPTNIATQGVFISEMGKKKVDVIRDRIKDINPSARVVCVDRFLDDSMSDEEFKGYMDLFPGRTPTDYLIMGCTDNFHAQKRSSILALKYGIPYLAAMMYKAGAAAELIFVYPGVTRSCPRCLLGSRFEKYEQGFVNDVDSSACTIFATERMNALKGYIGLMLLSYNSAPLSPFNKMLDEVKDRNFVQIRLSPDLKQQLGITLFDTTFEGASEYTYMDETLWIPQEPDHISNGYKTCTLCGGTGKLQDLYLKWKDTREQENR